MISASIQIPVNLEAALQGLKPDVMVAAVRRGMTRGGQLVAARVFRDRLSGQGPFSVSAHRLGVRTGRLRKSLRSTPATVNGMEVQTQIGSAVKYAAAHEFGFKGNVPVKAHQRVATKAFGVKLPSPRPHTVKAHQRRVSIPERAPVRTGITENLPIFSNEVASEVKSAMGNF